MNTATRRFILRLIVGLLAFFIGVGAAMALGGFRPFEGFTSYSNYRYKRHCPHWSSDATVIYPVYHEHVGRMPGQFEEMTPPPPPPASLSDAPMPPAPPRVVR